jgi:glutamyl-tRNA synthetase
MSAPVRVRFAPSPTGEPHLGNIRSALFNWLFARANGGDFIVRIEDTDRGRLVDGAQEAALQALSWLGLDWDEGPEKGGNFGPYIQSERQAAGIYDEHARRLIQEDKAYLCYCTSERLDQMRKSQQSNKQPTGYDRHCRELSDSALARLTTENPYPIVRFKMPLRGHSTVSDVVRGEVHFDLSLLDDFVLLKSDGFPTYHLANVVDDHLMEISHIMRAEEWLPSAPRHKALYEAFGYKMPFMVHLPIILGPDRSKLSKRHGATSILEYRSQGYLPDAMVNFLAMLGWSLDDATDVISREDLIMNFSLERILSSPAVFNRDKLDWLNGVYIRKLTPETLANEILPLLELGLPDEVSRPIDLQYLRRIVPLEQERLKWLKEAEDLMSFFFVERLVFRPEELIPKGFDRSAVAPMLLRCSAILSSVEKWEAPELESKFRDLAIELGVKTGDLFGVVRVAITGRKAAPPLFDTMAVLGLDRCTARLQAAETLL